MTVEKHAQVSAQCRVVAHLAMEIAGLYVDLAVMAAAGIHPDIMDMRGRESARLMNQLGDILNGCDAADAETADWTAPIFERARVMFPDDSRTTQEVP
ncbi:MAG: hypothetical protein ACOY4R_27375 [Pseudomonadota bacterium]